MYNPYTTKRKYSGGGRQKYEMGGLQVANLAANMASPVFGMMGSLADQLTPDGYNAALKKGSGFSAAMKGFSQGKGVMGSLMGIGQGLMQHAQARKEAMTNPRNMTGSPYGQFKYGGSPDFQRAFAEARKAGKAEFEWNSKRYNTKLANITDSNVKSIKALQQILKDAGYYQGKVDGIYGKLSSNAHRLYDQQGGKLPQLDLPEYIAGSVKQHRTVIKKGQQANQKIANAVTTGQPDKDGWYYPQDFTMTDLDNLKFNNESGQPVNARLAGPYGGGVDAVETQYYTNNKGPHMQPTKSGKTKDDYRKYAGDKLKEKVRVKHTGVSTYGRPVYAMQYYKDGKWHNYDSTLVVDGLGEFTNYNEDGSYNPNKTSRQQEIEASAGESEMYQSPYSFRKDVRNKGGDPSLITSDKDPMYPMPERAPDPLNFMMNLPSFTPQEPTMFNEDNSSDYYTGTVEAEKRAGDKSKNNNRKQPMSREEMRQKMQDPFRRLDTPTNVSRRPEFRNNSSNQTSELSNAENPFDFMMDRQVPLVDREYHYDQTLSYMTGLNPIGGHGARNIGIEDPFIPNSVKYKIIGEGKESLNLNRRQMLGKTGYSPRETDIILKHINAKQKDDLLTQYRGPGHEQGGIKIDLFGNPTFGNGPEVEGKETSWVTPDGYRYIFSDKLTF